MKKSYFLVLGPLISAYTYAQLIPPTDQQNYYNDVDFNNTGMDLFDDLAIETAAKHKKLHKLHTGYLGSQ